VPSVAAAVTAAAARLRAAGFPADDAGRDASVLARGLLEWSLADWLSKRDSAPPPGFVAAFDALVDRRLAREPVAYLLGKREFYGRPFAVRAAVLVPRPETELLVDVARTWIREGNVRTVADVGTGSGCVAITLVLEHPALAVLATDTSPDALSVARLNADTLGAGSIDWRLTDLLDGVCGPLDLIVSNPPYVPERDRGSLQPDVRDFEPALALFAGADGLDVIRRLVPAASATLRAGGGLVMEVGFGQSAGVTSLLEAAGFSDVTWHADLQGIPRVVAAFK
jgi:release factor glutamine methyltransferase